MMRQEFVMRQARKLVQSAANDAVRLAFLSEGDLSELRELDLAAVSEFRRSGNGSVEIKFVDRLAVLKWMMEQADSGAGPQRFYEALEKTAREAGGDKRTEKD